jgi:hypothetical protein
LEKGKNLAKETLSHAQSQIEQIDRKVSEIPDDDTQKIA